MKKFFNWPAMQNGLFFTAEKEKYKNYSLWSCQKVTDALVYLLDIYIRFGSKLYRQNVGIPMELIVHPLLLICFYFAMRDFMKSLTKEKQYDMTDAFNSTRYLDDQDFMKSLTKEKQYDMTDAFNSTRYLDDLLNIDYIYFEQMVHRIYPTELQLNKANASDNEAAFLDFNLSFHNDTVYDKRDDFDFDIINFPFLDGDVPRHSSYGVNISQFIRFARASSHVDDFNNRNRFLTAKLLKQGYRYHKLR